MKEEFKMYSISEKVKLNVSAMMNFQFLAVSLFDVISKHLLQKCTNEQILIPSEGYKIPNYLKGVFVRKLNVEAIEYAWILVFFSWKIQLLEKNW